jgi:two-component system OmpR family sensor kinase
MGWIAVIDHGEGIAQQIRDKIFQRFWRADTSRTRETGGSGLGLSIVASVVDALHGSIVVSETPGGGATFRVAFPLAQRRDAAEHLFIETQPLPRTSTPNRGSSSARLPPRSPSARVVTPVRHSRPRGC